MPWAWSPSTVSAKDLATPGEKTGYSPGHYRRGFPPISRDK
jgi:hypothetical protein